MSNKHSKKSKDLAMEFPIVNDSSPVITNSEPSSEKVVVETLESAQEGVNATGFAQVVLHANHVITSAEMPVTTHNGPLTAELAEVNTDCAANRHQKHKVGLYYEVEKVMLDSRKLRLCDLEADLQGLLNAMGAMKLQLDLIVSKHGTEQAKKLLALFDK